MRALESIIARVESLETGQRTATAALASVNASIVAEVMSLTTIGDLTAVEAAANGER